MENLNKLQAIFSRSEERLTKMFFTEFRLDREESEQVAKACVSHFAAAIENVLEESQDEG